MLYNLKITFIALIEIIIISGSILFLGQIACKKLFHTLNKINKLILYFLTGTVILTYITLIIGTYFFLVPFLFQSLHFSLFLLFIFINRKSLFNKDYFILIRKNIYDYKFYIIINLLFYAIILYFIAYPPVYIDTLAYHLGLPYKYALAKKIYTENYFVYTFYPINTEILFINFFMLPVKYPACSAFYLIIMIFIQIVSYKFLRLFQNKNNPFLKWEALSLTTLPILILLNLFLKNDFFLLLYFLSAIYFLILSYKSNNYKFLIFSFVLVGFTLGIKYNSLIFTGLYLLLYFSLFWKKNKSFLLITSLILIVCILLGLTPYYYRNRIITGNPFYPHLNSIFHNKINNFNTSPISLNGNLIIKSFKLYINKITFANEKYFIDGPIGPLFLLIIFLIILKFKKLSALQKKIVVFSILFIISVNLFHNLIRYSLLGYFLLILIAFTTLNFNKKKYKTILILFIISNLLLTLYFIASTMIINYFKDEQAKNKIYSLMFPYYRQIQNLNIKTNHDDKILVIGQPFSYFFDNVTINSSTWDLDIISILFNKYNTDKELANFFKTNKISYIFFCFIKNQKKIPKQKFIKNKIKNQFFFSTKKNELRFKNFINKYFSGISVVRFKSNDNIIFYFGYGKFKKIKSKN